MSEKAILVNLAVNPRQRLEAPESMDELEGLAGAAGAVVVHKTFQSRPSPSARTFIGEGKVEELKALRDEHGAGLVIFDHNLSPTQQRSLEKALEARVIDRTQLILDIFARRARSNEGKLQVELAQLGYLLPRLAGRGTAMSRLGGGIGTRGPGETKLEADRQRIRDRIARIKKEIKAVAKRRSGQRRSRRESLIPLVALVGYTSVGKSTLFNRLTGESAFTSPRLFATLDPLVRRTSLPDGFPYFLSDTVGFVKRLPSGLVSSFLATLEEVLEADLILHVIDLAAPGSEAQSEAVVKILGEIGAGGVPSLRVFNKIDRLPDSAALLERNHPGAGAVYVSAASGDGLAALKSHLRALLFKSLRVFYVRIPPDRPDLAASLSKRALVLKRRDGGGYQEMKIAADPSRLVDLAAFIVPGEPTW